MYIEDIYSDILSIRTYLGKLIMTTETTFDLNAHILALEAEFNDQALINAVKESWKTDLSKDLKWAIFLTAVKYYKPWQPYHNFEHAKKVVWAVLEIYFRKDSSVNFEVLVAAIWHDAIYVPGSQSNELLSVYTYGLEHVELGISANIDTCFEDRSLVMSLIRNTTIENHLSEKLLFITEEIAILLDADLSGLASSYKYAFEEPADVVERNYALFESIQMSIIQEHIGDGEQITDEHKQQSREFLKQFLNKKTIYRTPEAIEMWEAKARYNLTQYCYNHAT